MHEDRFYLKPGTQAKLEFNLVAEGLRKIALLWQLIKTDTGEGIRFVLGRARSKYQSEIYSGAG